MRVGFLGFVLHTWGGINPSTMVSKLDWNAQTCCLNKISKSLSSIKGLAMVK
jgi:hypothetical protein